MLKTVLKELEALPRKGDGEIYITALNPLVRKYKKQHDLACGLWHSGDRAARDLAVRIADPGKADDALLEHWVSGLDEWGVCDAFTGHLVKFTPYAEAKAFEWCKRKPEYERRAGFALIAQMAWSQNDFSDDFFVKALSFIEKYADDERYYVKKSVNWALRDIGKRNKNLKKYALALADTLKKNENRTSRWVGTHRIKEITGA